MGHKLGMGREAIFKLIRTTTERDGRPALGKELRKLEGKHRRLSSGINKRHDEEWFIQQRAEADERHQATREQVGRNRFEERERQGLGSRLDEVLTSLSVMSTAPAGAIAHQSRSSETVIPVGGPVPADIYGRRALLLIRAAEHELDRLRFGGADVRESTEQRNQRLINEYEGFTSWEVSFVEPSMGHPVTIERIRREAGRRSKDGSAFLREVA